MGTMGDQTVLPSEAEIPVASCIGKMGERCVEKQQTILHRTKTQDHSMIDSWGRGRLGFTGTPFSHSAYKLKLHQESIKRL